MKLLFLASPNSSHTVKLANSMSEFGIDVAVFGLSSHNTGEYHKKISFETVNYNSLSELPENRDLKKIIYLKALPKLMRFLKIFNPDIIHAHYASSYGLLGALTRKHPFFISIWGTDILEFPVKSILNKKIIKHNLKCADEVFVTSNYLLKKTKNYTEKNSIITPYGVNLDRFKKVDSNRDVQYLDSIVIGTIKSLEEVYGIDILIKAFHLVKQKCPDIKLKLLIVGDGSQKQNLQKLVFDLSLQDEVQFIGYVQPSKILRYFNNIDIFANLSRRESFGVAAVEALACKIPVVASDVGGLPEIILDNECGFLVEPENIDETASALSLLVNDQQKRFQFGTNGRLRVEKYFDWGKNILEIIKVYNRYLNKEIKI